MKKWLGRIAKISFVFIAIFGVGITVLFNMGGDSKTLQGAIEDYIAQSTGYAAQIGQFNKMTFFPNISIDAENITIKKPNLPAMQAWAKSEFEKPEAERGQVPPPIAFDRPDGTVEKFLISVGFLDAGLGRGRTISDLQIRNAQFEPGTIHAKSLTLKTLGIDETPEGKPYIAIDGVLGTDAFTAEIDVEGRGSKNRRKYSIGEESPFTVNVGSITMNGVLRARTMGGIHVRDLEISHNNQKVINASLTLLRTGKGIAEMRGDFEIPEYGSNGQISWDIMTQKNMQIDGTITAPLINARDMANGSRLSNAWAEWDRIFATDDTTANENHAIKVTAETYRDGNISVTNFSGAALIKNNQMVFKNIPQKAAE